ncbi:MAG: hypothetical protein NTY75_03480 [Candidatus Shapirobacteria bacterium]|nr:hypothetical protein [Candidatus Shapirobacteria bacterium]
MGIVKIGKIIFIGYRQEVKRCYSKLMLKKMWKKIKKVFGKKSVDEWGLKQLKEMGKLRAKIILM